jgi:hypothetical protein
LWQKYYCKQETKLLLTAMALHGAQPQLLEFLAFMGYRKFISCNLYAICVINDFTDYHSIDSLIIK